MAALLHLRSVNSSCGQWCSADGTDSCKGQACSSPSTCAAKQGGCCCSLPWGLGKQEGRIGMLKLSAATWPICGALRLMIEPIRGLTLALLYCCAIYIFFYSNFVSGNFFLILNFISWLSCSEIAEIFC